MFTPRMKLADLIKANHNIMLLLPRFGIPLGFGEKSVQDVCAAHNVPVDFMLLICNVYTFDDYLPDIEQLAATNMQPLVPYLKESHRYYTGERLPHIEAHLHHIADRVEGKYGQILKQFYADFRREIEDHFKYEEQYDFPVLLSLQNGERRKRSQMSHSQRSHSGLVDKMNDLPQIVYKYLPGNVLPEETIELVFDILQLSADIRHYLRRPTLAAPRVGSLQRPCSDARHHVARRASARHPSRRADCQPHAPLRNAQTAAGRHSDDAPLDACLRPCLPVC